MTRKAINDINSKGLLERIFFLFAESTDAAIAEKLGVVRQVVQGWRGGKSRPTLDQLEKIIGITGVDWQWLMTGKTESIDTLVNIYFPKLPKRGFNGRYDNYEFARIHLFGVIMSPWGGLDGLPELVHAIAVTWQSAVDAKYPDVLQHAKSELGPNFTDSDYIKFAENYTPSNAYISKAMKLTTQMRDSHVISQWISERRVEDAYNADAFIANAEKLAAEKGLPAPIGHRPMPSNAEWPVRGLAAADDSGGSRIVETDDYGDPIYPPSGLLAVPVTGESMSPVVLGGQYVLIDMEREGHEVDGEIVVASILEPESGDDYPEPIFGTFVKRCFQRENLYYFASVNTFSPFSAHVDHCRIWPVIGVWFGGKGKPPEGF